MHPIMCEDARLIADEDLPWEKLSGKTVLISGATGYVPAYFVHAIMMRNDIYKSNIKVIALCRSKERAMARFGEYMNRDDFVLSIQDVRDCIHIDEEIQFFIHAASPAGVKNSNTKPVETFTANVTGCFNMLELSVKNKTEGFLFLSSIDTYGKIFPLRRFIETDCGVLDSLNPRNVYAISKRAAEHLCACYLAQYEIPVVIVRPSQIMGLGIALDDGRLHIDFISQILSAGKIILKSDGSAKRSFMYITDAICGMLTVLLKASPGEVYNIVDENGEATVLELAILMASLVQDRKVEVFFNLEKRNLPEVRQALSVVAGDSGKLRKMGWRPRFSLREGAQRMMHYYGL